MVEKNVCHCGGVRILRLLGYVSKSFKSETHILEGSEETIEQLKQYPIEQGKKVLEVGCGTGRTACYLGRAWVGGYSRGFRPEIITKANIRAEKPRR